MSSINDWAAKAAQAIHLQYDLEVHRADSVPRIAAIIAQHAEPLVALLRESKREHVNTLSRDGSSGVYCQTFMRDTQTGEIGPCTCGADAWNKRVEAALND